MKVFDAGKTRMIGLPYGEKPMTTIMLSRFHTIPVVLTRDKNKVALFMAHGVVQSAAASDVCVTVTC